MRKPYTDSLYFFENLIDNPKKLYYTGKYLKKRAKKNSRKDSDCIDGSRNCRNMQKRLSELRKAS